MKKELTKEKGLIKVGEIVLKPHEVEILRLVAGGKLSKEIAPEVNYAKRTIDNKIRSICLRIGVGNRSEATTWFNNYFYINGKLKEDSDVITPILDKGPFEITSFDYRSLLKTLDIKEIIYKVKEATYNAHYLRNAGYPKQVIKKLNYWINVSEDRIKAKLDSTKAIRDLKYELIRALAERMACYSIILDRDKIVELMLKDNAKGLSLSISLNDNKGMGMIHSWTAACFYVAGDWEKAKDNEYKALPLIQHNPALVAEAQRGLMLDYAHLHKPNEFLRIERMALEDIKHGIFVAPMNIAAIYDGSGRGRAILEKPHVEERLDRAEKETKKFSKQMKIKPQRPLQISCSWLIYLTKMKEQGISIDIKNASKIAFRGHCLAKTLGYDRYIIDIDKWARELNIKLFENPNNNMQLHLDFPT